jgi:hypothetical protein
MAFVLDVDPNELWIDTAAALVDDTEKFKAYAAKLEESKRKEDAEKKKLSRWKDRMSPAEFSERKRNLPSLVLEKIVNNVPEERQKTFQKLEFQSRAQSILGEYSFPGPAPRLESLYLQIEESKSRSLPTTPVMRHSSKWNGLLTPISPTRRFSTFSATTPPTPESKKPRSPLKRQYPIVSEPTPLASQVVPHLLSRHRPSKIFEELKMK